MCGEFFFLGDDLQEDHALASSRANIAAFRQDLPTLPSHNCTVPPMAHNEISGRIKGYCWVLLRSDLLFGLCGLDYHPTVTFESHGLYDKQG